MATPTIEDVVVTLSAQGGSDFPFPARVITLNQSRKSFPIGRATKRSDELSAGPDNAWVPSRVMSRHHAEIFVDLFYQKLFVKDLGSLHGTFVNKIKVAPQNPSPLRDGDILTLGVPVEKHPEIFQPCTFKVYIKFGTAASSNPPRVFRVPDETDDDLEESDLEVEIQHTRDILDRSGIRRAIASTIGKMAENADPLTDVSDQPMEDAVLNCFEDHISISDDDEDSIAPDDIEDIRLSESYSEMDDDAELSDSEMSADSDEKPQEADLEPEQETRNDFAELVEDDPDIPSSPVREEQPPRLASLSDVLALHQDTDQTSCMLPPILLQKGPDAPPMSVPEDKREYFAAREANKRRLEMARQRELASLPLAPNSSIVDAKEDVPHLPAGSSEAAARQIEQTPSHQKPEIVCVRTGSTIPSGFSFWESSGEKFLHSPLEDPPRPPSASPKLPELDETSAYLYNLSKQRRANSLISDAVEKPGATKRKLNEISTATAEEQAAMGQTAEGPAVMESPESQPEESPRGPFVVAETPPTECSSPPKPTQVDQDCQKDTQPLPEADAEAEDVESSDSRSPKRLRSVAQAVGYAALGGAATGVAILSALIATGPTFV